MNTAPCLILKGTKRSTVVIWVKKIQNELMVQIYSKSLVRDNGKVLLTESSENTN